MPTATVTRPDIPPVYQQSPFVPGVQPPEPFTLVIFGATGNLAARKLLPALHRLWQDRFLPRAFAVVGVGRRDKNDDVFREASLPEFPNYAAGTWGPAEADRLAEGCLGGWRHP